MCGRACCSCPTSAIAATYGVSPDCVYGGDRFQPRYNLHPGHKSPVIVREANYKKHRPHQAKHEGGKEGKGGGEGGEPAKGCKKRKDEGGEEVENAKAVVVMHWGLIPSWHKEGEKLDFFRAFNARSETVDSKPMFRRLVGSKRCIVCMEGFYEWKKDLKGGKQPYYCHSSDPSRPLLSLAGLYDTWFHKKEGEDGREEEEKEVMFSYTILTTDASPSFSWLHNRMPLILRSKAEEEAWLEGGKDGGRKIGEILSVVRGEGGKEGGREVPFLVCEPVSKRMSNMQYEGKDCTMPIKLEEEKEGREEGGKETLHAFFGGGKESGRKEGEGGRKAGSAFSSPVAAGNGKGEGKGRGKTMKKEEGEEKKEEDNKDEVVILPPGKIEVRGGGGGGGGGGKGGEGGGGGGKIGKKGVKEEHAEKVLSGDCGESGKKRGGKGENEAGSGERNSAEKRQKTMTSFFTKNK